MKRIFVLVLIGLLLLAGITGCTKDKNSNTNPVNQNQKDETKIRNIAFQWLNNNGTIKLKEWKAAKVIETKYTDDHKVYKGDETINIKGIDTYKVIFEMSEEEVWGGTTITVYVDKESENILGTDLIAR